MLQREKAHSSPTERVDALHLLAWLDGQLGRTFSQTHADITTFILHRLFRGRIIWNWNTDFCCSSLRSKMPYPRGALPAGSRRNAPLGGGPICRAQLGQCPLPAPSPLTAVTIRSTWNYCISRPYLCSITAPPCSQLREAPWNPL